MVLSVGGLGEGYSSLSKFSQHIVYIAKLPWNVLIYLTFPQYILFTSFLT